MMILRTRSAQASELPRGVEHRSGYLGRAAAMMLRTRIERCSRFEVHGIRMFGRFVPVPRQTAWFAPRGMDYAYSGHCHVGAGMPAWLDLLRSEVADACGVAFATILATRYRDGSDAVGWHADKEAELGPAPTIAILSLGATRDLCFRERGQGGARWRVPLADGDLLIMRAGVQDRLQHAVPKRARVGVRVSLSFRPFETGR